MIEKVARKDAQAVAGFFGFGAIGVEDSQAEIGPFAGRRAPENAIGTDDEIAVSDNAGLRSGGRAPAGKVAGIHDNVIVAEGVVFVEAHVRWGRRIARESHERHEKNPSQERFRELNR